MTPEQKCVSLETAKKLVEAGLYAYAERAWVGEGMMKMPFELRTLVVRSGITGVLFPDAFNPIQFHTDATYYPAPDAQEMGELLPEYILTLRTSFDEDGKRWLCTKESDAKCELEYEHLVFEKPYFYADNEAEARAACWLYLKENNLLTRE